MTGATRCANPTTRFDGIISMVERHERGLPEQATTLMLEGQWNEGRTLRPLPK